MTPSVTAVRMTGSGRESLPLLVLGPSLGTSASRLWRRCAEGLTDVFDVVAWDLPGHGHNRAVPEEDFTLAELAAGVLAVVDDILDQRDEHGGQFFVAGDSVGGAVACQLLLDAPGRVGAAAALCAAARFATPDAWRDRIARVEASGTAGLVDQQAVRWFGPGFAAREPATAAALLDDLRATEDGGYVGVCRALTTYDVRVRLGEIGAPLLVVAGADDRTAPPARELAEGVAGSRFVSLPGVGHLAPVEAPEETARLLREHFLGAAPSVGRGGRSRSVELEQFVADHEAGRVTSAPGLDPRTRAMVTLTTLVAHGDLEGFESHLVDAGLALEEVKGLLMQTALHGGVASAAAAFDLAEQVLGDE